MRVLSKGDQIMFFTQGYAWDQDVWAEVTDNFADDYKHVLFDCCNLEPPELSHVLTKNKVAMVHPVLTHDP